jgi:hypothetical protein
MIRALASPNAQELTAQAADRQSCLQADWPGTLRARRTVAFAVCVRAYRPAGPRARARAGQESWPSAPARGGRRVFRAPAWRRTRCRWRRLATRLQVMMVRSEGTEVMVAAAAAGTARGRSTTMLLSRGPLQAQPPSPLGRTSPGRRPRQVLRRTSVRWRDRRPRVPAPRRRSPHLQPATRLPLLRQPRRPAETRRLP